MCFVGSQDVIEYGDRWGGVRVAPADRSNLRELASACSQLAADTGGKIDPVAVRALYEHEDLCVPDKLIRF